MKFHSFAAAVAVGLFALTGVANAADKVTIGIAMPTKSSARWIADGDNIVKVLQGKGYNTDLQYADNDIPNQLAQIENMITKNEKVLVIAAIDGTTLSDALQKAHDAGIKVISYDRLIRGSANVDYYATFDNFKVGVLQATSIVHGLGIDAGKTGPFNIELFGGSADDNNAFFFYNGAMSVLQPLIDKGTLVIQSKQMGMDKVATLRWDAATAQARMDNLLSAPSTPARRSTPCCRRMTASRSASSRRSRASATARRISRCRSSPARTRKSRRSSRSSLTSSIRPCSRTPAISPRSPPTWSTRVLAGKAAGSQRHQDLQQRRQGRSVLPADPGVGRRRQRAEGAGRRRLLQGRPAQMIG